MSTESQSTTQAPARSSRPPLISIADFNPTQAESERLLSLMADPDYNIGGAARSANTSIEAFTLWLTRPDISARLDALESVIARKVRLDVASHSSGILTACSTTIGFYNEAMNHRYIAANDHRGHSIRIKEQSNALLASRILLHLAKHFAPQSPRSGSSSPNHNRNPNPNLPNPNSNNTHDASDNSRFTVLPPLANLTNLHDQRAANHTTSPNPTRDNTHDTASTSPSRKRRSDAPSSAHEMGAPWLPDAPASGTPPAHLQAHEMGDRSACIQSTTSPPTSNTPATPGKSPCACPSKSKRKPCISCASTPIQLLTRAGTTTPRKREHPKPTH